MIVLQSRSCKSCQWLIWSQTPRYLFSALSIFNWACWIAPNDPTVNTLFGYSSGLGLSILTFDWAQIAYTNSPLLNPWWAQANFLMGFVFFWVIVPILYFTNTWYAQYLPILSSYAFDNTGAHYNVTHILTPNNTLDQAKYEAYSPLFLPTAFAVSYGLGFAVISATLSHTFLYFRKQILSVMQSRNLPSRRSDIHARLMSKYKEVPQWWYGVIFSGTFVFAIVSIKGSASELPVWALILALSIAFIYVVPLGMIAAITKYVILLSVM